MTATLHQTNDTEYRTLTIRSDRCGPPNVSNGGWVAGSLSQHIPGGDALVELHAPAPVDEPMVVARTAYGASLWHGDVLVAEAVAASPLAAPPAPVSRRDAVTAAARFAAHRKHPYPRCFVCGPEHGHGMEVFPGDIPGRTATVATPWTPAAEPDGTVATASVWAALDCPSGWAVYQPGRVTRLARVSTRILRPIQPGRQYVIVGEARGCAGGTHRSVSAVYDGEGTLHALATAEWVEVG